MNVIFHGQEFPFEMKGFDELSVKGKIVFRGDLKTVFDRLLQLEEENEEKNGPWYLNPSGERLPTEQLFEASPWSLSVSGKTIKLLSRYQNHGTGEVYFHTRDGYSGELYNRV